MPRRFPIPDKPAVILDPMTDTPLPGTGLTWDQFARAFCIVAGLRKVLTTYEIDALKDSMRKAAGAFTVEEKVWEVLCDEINHPTVFQSAATQSPDVLAVFRGITEAEKV